MNLARAAIVLALLGTSAGTSLGGTFNMKRAPIPLGPIEFHSKNEQFVLKLDPEGYRNVVYRASDPTTPLWLFPGVLKTDVRIVLLSNDGAVVAVVRESNSNDPDREGVRLIRRDGTYESYPVQEYPETPQPSKPTFGGCGGSGSTPSWIYDVTDHGDYFVIQTTGGREHTIPYHKPPLILNWRTAAAATGVVGLVIVIVLVLLMSRPPEATYSVVRA